jgi:integrase/recombinase XerD
MLQWLATRPLLSERLARSPLKGWLTDYLAYLTAQGYSKGTLPARAGSLLRFGEFLARQGSLDINNISQWVEPFLNQHLPRLRSAHATTDLNGFLRYLRQTGAIPAPEPVVLTPHAELIQAYCTSLATLRALRGLTIRHIRGTCRSFLAFLDAEGGSPLHSLQPEAIHRFLISQGQTCCRSSLKTRCTWLRGFLSYLHRCGVIATDLSAAVVAPRIYQQERAPRFLTRPQIDAVLALVDRSTPAGRRDHAMLLLTVYGLRGMEVLSLRLDDIDWRNRKLCVRRRKAGNSTTYPLASSVDDAIVAYLRDGRPTSAHREVFLSLLPPFRPLATVDSLAKHIVRYLQRAGITRPRPGPHLFRYSCAQRLLDEGMPLKLIGDYLGHTSTQTTQFYTKIAIEQLREVALSDAEELL